MKENLHFWFVVTNKSNYRHLVTEKQKLSRILFFCRCSLIFFNYVRRKRKIHSRISSYSFISLTLTHKHTLLCLFLSLSFVRLSLSLRGDFLDAKFLNELKTKTIFLIGKIDSFCFHDGIHFGNLLLVTFHTYTFLSTI